MDGGVTLILIACGIIALVVLIRFIFSTPKISHTLGLLVSIASIIAAIKLKDPSTCFIPCGILTALSWMFVMGDLIFQKYWDGSVDVTRTSETTRNIKPHIAGGFFSSLFSSLALSGIVYAIFGLAVESVVIYYVIPALLILFHFKLLSKAFRR